MKKLFLLTISTLLVQSCSTYEQPELSSIQSSLQEDLTKDIAVDYIPVSNNTTNHGSLWQNGSKGFFKDNRAKSVGDIITVIISVSISAETAANTQANQTNTSKSGVTNLLNLADNLTNKGLTLGAGGLIDTDSARAFTGSGKTDRKDTLSTTVAAVVTQVLPNGHLIIRGQREVSLNYEKQQLQIAGIVRPEDVSANNTISSNQIAQARIAYGGKGNVNEVQTKKWGSKFLDRWMPF